MLDITAIILTKNEEMNLPDCIRSIQHFVRRIIVVDSYSTDNTVQIAQRMGAEVLQHKWINLAKQYMWAMEQIQIDTEWIFRIDADERISAEAAKEIEAICRNDDPAINGIVIRYTVEFMGKELKHGGIYPFKKLLIYRNGHGKIEDRAMDEHIVLLDGRAIELGHDSYHHDYKNIEAWINKHNQYSTREVIDYYSNKQCKHEDGRMLYGTAKLKRWFKFNVYYRLPIGTRAHLYYIYRYYLRFGFLDGKEGKIFCFLQAYWYRFLVDAKIYEAELKERE